MQQIGLERIEAHNRAVRQTALSRLLGLPGVRLLGPQAAPAAGPLSFVITGVSAHVVARSLSDGYGMCIRSAFHCAQPLHEGLHSMPARLSFYLYNQPSELDLPLTR